MGCFYLVECFFNKKAFKIFNYSILMNKESNYNKEYYEKNKVHINNRATRQMQCAKCLRIVQFRGIRAHKLTAKCERDYNKRMALDNKPKQIDGVFNEPIENI